MRGVLPSVVTAVTLLAGVARADDAARADALFAQGKQEMSAGRHAKACALFSESFALDPSDGTLLALGLCHEQAGDHARAFAELRESDERATRSNREDRQRVARAALARVTPRVARVVIHGDPRGCKQVTLDDAPAALDVELAVEPGAHRVVCVQARRGAAVDVTAVAGALRLVDLPVAPVAPPPPLAESSPPAARVARAPDDAGAAWRTAGWVTGAVGLVALGIGGLFGLRAADQWLAVEAKCDPRACADPSAVADSDAARTSATIANVGVIAGALLVAGGLYLVLSNRAPARASAAR